MEGSLITFTISAENGGGWGTMYCRICPLSNQPLSRFGITDWVQSVLTSGNNVSRSGSFPITTAASALVSYIFPYTFYVRLYAYSGNATAVDDTHLAESSVISITAAASGGGGTGTGTVPPAKVAIVTIDEQSTTGIPGASCLTESDFTWKLTDGPSYGHITWYRSVESSFNAALDASGYAYGTMHTGAVHETISWTVSFDDTSYSNLTVTYTVVRSD